MISEDTPNATSLPVSVAGQSHCVPRCGVTIDLFGQEAAPASPSARQESKKATVTSATYGRIGQGSSQSQSLQSSLESKLHQLLPTAGGTMWPQIWKRKNTPALRRYCQLAVSAKPTGETDCGLWLTPRANEIVEPAGQAAKRLGDRREVTACSLAEQASTALWPTPTSVMRDDDPVKRADRGKKHGFGAAWTLPMFATMWPTQTTHNAKEMGTPADYNRNTVPLGALVKNPLNGLCVQTESKGQLNPAFVSWLMGYSTEHLSSMHLAMQSFRKSRQSSSKRTKKAE